MDKATAATRVAIEFLTLWLEPGDAARDRAIAHIVGALGEPVDGNEAMAVISGF
jgi:hypothetical protein